MFERALRFHEWRHINLVVDPEHPREVKRGKNRGRLFAFRDQHPDRRVRIDVRQDLRHSEKLTQGRAVLNGERGEVGT